MFRFGSMKSDGRDIELRTGDAHNFNGLTAENRRTTLVASWSGVAAAAMDVSNFAHPVRGNRGDDRADCPYQEGDMGFAGALGFMKNCSEKQHDGAGDYQATERSQRGADPRAFGRFNAGQDQPQSAKG